MATLAAKRKKGAARLCPVRHTLLLAALAVIGAYFAFRGKHEWMVFLSDRFVRPCHNAMATLCDRAAFSVAELIYALVIVVILVYIIYSVIALIRQPERGKRLYRMLVTLAMTAALFYAGFCLLWGVYYYGDSFAARAGLTDEPVSAAQLETVTRYFAQLANERSNRVQRDENGVFSVPREELLEKGRTLYDGIEETFPALAGEAHRPKPMVFSKVMSAIEFTGFFFPFTGEANLNTDSPVCFLPSTIAHELAHQRGVAKEQEANFAAVAVSLENGDDDFVYSAALLAYVHLGNALYDADHAAWERVYASLNGQVRADFAANRAYWSKYDDTAVSKASDAVYETFLESYGQTLGLKSYGACVDLLVAYYYEEASEAVG